MTTCGFATWAGGLRGGGTSFLQTLEFLTRIFPTIGTFSRDFSNDWKFQRRFFQTLENSITRLELRRVTWIILLEVGSSRG